MKNRCLIILQILLFSLLISLPAYAAPTLSSINGFMGSEWNDLSRTTSESDRGNLHKENGHSDGDEYDVEKLGIYINDNTLFLGLQADYDFTNEGQRYKPGDFIFKFGGDPKYTLALDFSITGDSKYPVNNDVSLDWHYGDTDTLLWEYPSKHQKDTPYRANSSSAVAISDYDYEAEYTHKGSNHTLEIAINLDNLSTDLSNLFAKNSVDAHWQMGCGNDILYAADQYKYTYSQTPEPATLLLFGMGLLGAGAYGRKRTGKKTNSI